jgi:nucleotide-binding universal stress UspA family protein
VETLYDRMLVVIDASPDSPDNSLSRTIQFATMSGSTVYLLHVARGHLIPMDISAGSGLGVPSVEDDADERERQVEQSAVHGEMIEATEHDVADVVIQRAKELDVDLIVLGFQYYRGSTVAESVIHQQPHCSILLARPPEPDRPKARPRESTPR